MEREKLNELYDLLDEFYWKYPVTENDCDLVQQVQDMIQNELKISDCWNIQKAV